MPAISHIKLWSFFFLDTSIEGATSGIENIADAVTHARFVGTDPGSDEVVLMKILQVISVCLFVCLPVCLSVCLSSVGLCVGLCLSVCLLFLSVLCSEQFHLYCIEQCYTKCTIC